MAQIWEKIIRFTGSPKMAKQLILIRDPALETDLVARSQDEAVIGRTANLKDQAE
jgi:hypothetical protein